MNYNFSLAQLTVLDASPTEITRIAAECGYDYVSMRQIYMGLPGEPDYDLHKNRPLMKETKKILEETGIKVLDIELARIFDDMNLEKYRPAMETGQELGAKHILSSIWTDNKEYYIEQFAKLCDMAKEYDLTVELEYVPIAGVKNLNGALEVLDTVNRENAGLMVDMHHIQRAGDTAAELAKVDRKYLKFAHLCDAIPETPSDRDELVRIMREERLYCGEGGIDIASILRALYPLNTLSIELPNAKYVKSYGYKEHAKRCLETAKEYIIKNQL